MADLASLRIIVYGRVQGVNFRAFTVRQATKLGLTGYVRNLSGGRALEILAEGERDKLETLIGYVRVGPPAARVEQVTTDWSEYQGNYSGFGVSYKEV